MEMPAVMRNGRDVVPPAPGQPGRAPEVAVAPFCGSDAGRDGTGLRLNPLGRMRDATGRELCTVWCLLNASNRPHAVTLYAPQVTGQLDTSFRLALTLPPHTQSTVCSPVVAWPAMHLLSEGVRLIDVKHASSEVYNDGSSGAARGA